MLAFLQSSYPLWQRKLSFPVTRQHDLVDCGPACLQMIAKYYGKTHALQSLRDLAGIDRQGVSLLGLSEAAERIGFRTLAVQVSFDQLAAQVPLPCVAHWMQRHFVVVYAVDPYRVYTADPASGLVSYTKEEFLKGWLASGTGTVTHGVLLLLEPTPAFAAHEEDPTPEGGGFRVLGSYLKTHTKLIKQLLIGVGTVSVLQLILPFLTEALVDIGIANQDLHFIYLILLAQLMLLFSRTAVECIQSWIVLHVGTRVDIHMISDFLSKLMRLPVAYFDAKTTGDLLQRILDHARVQTFLSHTSLNVLLSLFSMLVFSLVLILYSAKIFGVFAVGSFLYLAYIIVFLKRRKELDYKRFSQLSDNQNLLIETINGMPDLKLNNAEQQQRWQWERLQARLFRISISNLALEQYQQGGAVLINEVKNVVITVMAAQQVIAGEMTLGALLAIQYIMGQLNGPLNQLIAFLHAAQDAKISMERMNDVRTLKDEEQDQQQLMMLPERPALHMHDVGFRYSGPQNEPVLEHLNLTIPHGQMTAIVGTSGSGKTTLMKLFLRFYEPSSGSLTLGDVKLRNFSHRFWRERCGVVMQEGRIFSDTIARNIALGEESIDKGRLLEAVKIACIQPFIESLPLAYNTKVGIDGVGLSQGQKQRLLIARAIYKNPQYLFFDEATSALDAETERAITENLQQFFKGRTVVVIAHRLSTVRHADQIVVLQQGHIVECGSHDDLVARRSQYYHLVKNQLELGS